MCAADSLEQKRLQKPSKLSYFNSTGKSGNRKATGQQPKSCCHQEAFLYAGQYKCRQIAVCDDQRLRRAGNQRANVC